MSLKVIVPNGRTEITVNGLHQWDYGRAIEIHAEGLPAIVEVHFACSGMETAIVRSCETVGGKVTAAIPDRCLEQTTPVTAWVYAIGETSGETILTVKLPIIARAQPQLAPTVPEDVSNKYTEAVAAMNALVEQGENMIGDIANEVEDRIAGNLYNEGWKARFAGRADTAAKADTATRADTAAEADTAAKATNDGDGNNIANTYAKKDEQKTLYYKVDGVPSIYKGAVIAVGTFPSNKTADDIASIGMGVGFFYPNDIANIHSKNPKNGWIRLSGVKMVVGTTIDPQIGACLYPFYTTAITQTSDGLAGVSSMDVTAYVKNNTLYLQFDDGFYTVLGTDLIDSLPSSDPNSNNGFSLAQVCVCLT